MSDERKIIQDSRFGFRRLDPVPSQQELDEFYARKYYELVQSGGRFPEARRLASGGESADLERRWMRETLFADVRWMLEQFAPGRRVLDVGCGSGELIAYLGENGFNVQGLEPSKSATDSAVAAGLDVAAMPLAEYVAKWREKSPAFDAVLMMNVLEHVVDPVGTLEMARRMLAPGGVICVRVPNDFSQLQQAAHEAIGGRQWWVTVPDHVNYFDFQSLRATLAGSGFEVLHEQGDFPMEMFLLMGDNYIGGSRVGGECHERRRRFEMSLDVEYRRKIYGSLAAVGVGRTCIMAARKLD